MGVIMYCADFPSSYARSPDRRVLYSQYCNCRVSKTDTSWGDSTTVQYLLQYRTSRSCLPRSVFVIAVAREPTWAEMLGRGTVVNNK